MGPAGPRHTWERCTMCTLRKHTYKWGRGQRDSSPSLSLSLSIFSRSMWLCIESRHTPALTGKVLCEHLSLGTMPSSCSSPQPCQTVCAQSEHSSTCSRSDLQLCESSVPAAAKSISNLQGDADAGGYWEAMEDLFLQMDARKTVRGPVGQQPCYGKDWS